MVHLERWGWTVAAICLLGAFLQVAAARAQEPVPLWVLIGKSRCDENFNCTDLHDPNQGGRPDTNCAFRICLLHAANEPTCVPADPTHSCITHLLMMYPCDGVCQATTVQCSVVVNGCFG